MKKLNQLRYLSKMNKLVKDAYKEIIDLSRKTGLTEFEFGETDGTFAYFDKCAKSIKKITIAPAPQYDNLEVICVESVDGDTIELNGYANEIDDVVSVAPVYYAVTEFINRKNREGKPKERKVLSRKVDITETNLKKAEQVLIDNGIESDEAETVLQAIGYTLLDAELYKED